MLLAPRSLPPLHPWPFELCAHAFCVSLSLHPLKLFELFKLHGPLSLLEELFLCASTGLGALPVKLLLPSNLFVPLAAARSACLFFLARARRSRSSISFLFLMAASSVFLLINSYSITPSISFDDP